MKNLFDQDFQKINEYPYKQECYPSGDLRSCSIMLLYTYKVIL